MSVVRRPLAVAATVAGALAAGALLVAAGDPETAASSGRPPSLLDGLPQVGTRVQTYATHAAVTDGSTAGATARVRHTTVVAGRGLRVAFGNFWNDPGDPLGDGPNDKRVKAAVETPNGRLYRLRFDGRRIVRLGPNDVVLSDPVDVPFTAGGILFSRTWEAVDDPEHKRPVSLTLDGAAGEGTGPGDVVDATGPPGPAAGAASGPIALLGLRTDPGRVPVVALAGDSITQGTGEDLAFRQRGFAIRALADRVPHVRFPRGSETAADFRPPRSSVRLGLFQGASHALVAYGRNDLAEGRTVGEVKADLQRIWTTLHGMGMEVWQTTIVPSTRSDDQWETAEGQHGWPEGYEAARRELNAWIRGDPAPLAGHVETADAVEPARDAGVWKPRFTPDGIHPSSAGHAAMAAAVDASRFTVPQATTPVPYGASGWRLRTVAPGLVPRFSALGFREAGFTSAGLPAAGPTTCKPPASPAFAWPAGTDLLARRAVDLPPGARDARVAIATDESAEVFVNGHDVSLGARPQGFCPVRGSLVVHVPDDALVAGPNVVAIRAADRARGGLLDVQVSAATG